MGLKYNFQGILSKGLTENMFENRGKSYTNSGYFTEDFADAATFPSKTWFRSQF